MHQITIQEAKAHFDSVFSEVLNGEEIIITDDAKPVAKMSPVISKSKGRGLVGSAPDLIKYMAEDFDETPEDFKDYM
jgi:antitoxin (DNA-binding transcriptional repressor) of toxin-antitoxin stability system